MNILIDIFIILFIAITTYINYKKGLVEVAFKLVSFFIAILISIILFNPISLFLEYNTNIDEYIQNYINNIIEETTKENIESDFSHLPNTITSSIDLTIENTSSNVSYSIAHTILNILSFFIVFFITKIILMFLQIFSDAIANLPIIKQFNTLGGFIYGFFKAFIIIFIVLTIISILPLTEIQLIINSTNLTLFLYNINPMLLLFF